MTLTVEDQALKKASRELARAAGGQEAAEGLCRVGQSQLSDYGNVNKPSAFMPVDVVAALEAVTHDYPGYPHVTKELARRAGFGLAPLPRPTPEDKSWLEHIATLSKEANEVTAKLATSAATGVTPKTIKEHRLLEETDEAIQALIDLRAQLRAVMGA